MTGLVRKAILLTVGASLLAGAAMASTPSAANSSFPSNGILLVGTNAGNAPPEDVAGQFSVTVNDGTPLPIQGATVTVNFNACTPDIKLSRVQSFTGVSVICNGALGVVSAQTNNLGVATFRILGGAFNNTGNAPGNTTKCAEIRANNVFFSNVAVAVIDQAGTLDGAGPGDLAVVITDVNQALAPPNVRRSDFVGFDAIVGPGDLAQQITYVNQGRSQSNTAAVCP